MDSVVEFVFIIFTLQREWENLAELLFPNLLLYFYRFLMNLYVVSYYLSCYFDFPRVSKMSVGSLMEMFFLIRKGGKFLDDFLQVDDELLFVR